MSLGLTSQVQMIYNVVSYIFIGTDATDGIVDGMALGAIVKRIEIQLSNVNIPGISLILQMINKIFRFVYYILKSWLG